MVTFCIKKHNKNVVILISNFYNYSGGEKMNRILNLRKKNKVSQKMLADKIQITQQALSLYEKEKRIPSTKVWQALADYFNVSIPYLQGAYSSQEIKKVILGRMKANQKSITAYVQNEPISKIEGIVELAIIEAVRKNVIILIATNTYPLDFWIKKEHSQKEVNTLKQLLKIKAKSGEFLKIFKGITRDAIKQDLLTDVQDFLKDYINLFTEEFNEDMFSIRVFQSSVAYLWLIGNPTLQVTREDVFNAFIEACTVHVDKLKDMDFV